MTMNHPTNEKELTILMPCLNEEGTIGKCVAKAIESIRKNGLSAEVLITDNGSTDNSVSIAENLGARVVSVNEKGYDYGLRGFNRQSIINIDLTTTGMEFASEMVVKATLNKLKITEVPTILYPDERNKPPHLNTWSDGWRHLRFLLIYSPRWLFLYPGIFMLLIGLLLSTALIFKQVNFLHVNFDVHTLLYSITFFYIGYQFVSFYIFTRNFGISNGLLPHSKRFENFLNFLKLERGIFIGLFFLLAGILLSIFALQIWKESGFGGLNPSEVFRVVIPASFLIIVGMQTILNSFFLSILGLRKQEKKSYNQHTNNVTISH
jgi:glycosyltransferase involved in cell wall biosynthesis